VDCTKAPIRLSLTGFSIVLLAVSQIPDHASDHRTEAGKVSSAVEGAEFGVVEGGVEGPYPAVFVVPGGVVDGGDEVVDVPGAADVASLRGGLAIKQRNDGGEHCGAAGGIAAEIRATRR